MKKIVNLLVIGLMSCVFALSFSPVPAKAGTVIDFGTGSAGNGGLFTLVGPNATGTGIPLDTLSVSGAPGFGVYDLSGAFVSSTAVGSTSAVLDFDTGVSGNFIKITGGVPNLNIPNGTVLLSGSFSSFQTFQSPYLLGFFGQGTDTKDYYLLTALGVNPNIPFHFFGFTTAIAQTGTAVSTDITNTQVPEPATMLLLGSGLIGLAGFARRRFRK